MENVYLERPWVKHYDKHVPASLDLDDKSFCETFRDVVRQYPYKPAVNYLGKILTFRDLDCYSNKLAHYFKKHELTPGSVIALHIPNIPAHYIALLAIQKADCVSTGLSPQLTSRELIHQIDDSNSQMLITMDILYEKIFEAAPQTGVKHILVSSAGDFLPAIKVFLGKMLNKIPQAEIKPIPGIQVERFISAIHKRPKSEVHGSKGMNAPMLMMYTGGTTGPAKGALLTQQNFMNNIHQVKTWLDLGAADSFLSAFPLFNIAGLCTGAVSMLTGITQIAVPNPQDTDFLIDAIRKCRPTCSTR